MPNRYDIENSGDFVPKLPPGHQQITTQLTGVAQDVKRATKVRPWVQQAILQELQPHTELARRLLPNAEQVVARAMHRQVRARAWLRLYATLRREGPARASYDCYLDAFALLGITPPERHHQYGLRTTIYYS